MKCYLHTVYYSNWYMHSSDLRLNSSLTTTNGKNLLKGSYHIMSTIKLLNLLTLFSFFTIIKLERKIQLENCAFLVPLSSCNKYEKYMCNGQMAGRQNTHSKWRTVFHTTQTKSKQQNCCKQKQNNISHQHSRQRKFTGKEAGKRTRKK